MNNKHLFWIIPTVFITSLFIGEFIVAWDSADMLDRYPIIKCIYIGDEQMNILNNKLFITKENQMRYLERRCAEATINFTGKADDLLQVED